MGPSAFYTSDGVNGFWLLSSSQPQQQLPQGVLVPLANNDVAVPLEDFLVQCYGRGALLHLSFFLPAGHNVGELPTRAPLPARTELLALRPRSNDPCLEEANVDLRNSTGQVDAAAVRALFRPATTAHPQVVPDRRGEGDRLSNTQHLPFQNKEFTTALTSDLERLQTGECIETLFHRIAKSHRQWASFNKALIFLVQNHQEKEIKQLLEYRDSKGDNVLDSLARYSKWDMFATMYCLHWEHLMENVATIASNLHLNLESDSDLKKAIDSRCDCIRQLCQAYVEKLSIDQLKLIQRKINTMKSFSSESFDASSSHRELIKQQLLTEIDKRITEAPIQQQALRREEGVRTMEQITQDGPRSE